MFKEKKKAQVQEKALTRDFTPYCFSTFSRSCLKHASMRSWKGLSASVTFSPWIRTPSARCGIWWKKNSSVRQVHQTHPGLQRWEISYMLLLPSEECISVCHKLHKLNFMHMSFGSLPSWMCIFSTSSKSTSVILHMHCKLIQVEAGTCYRKLLPWHYRRFPDITNNNATYKLKHGNEKA